MLFWWQCSWPMRMYSTLALISCNAALRGRREGVGGRDMYVERELIRHSREHGKRRERGGRCRAQMIDGSFRCHVCHATLSAYDPHLPYTHTMCACIYTHLYSAIHIVAVRKLIQWLHFSLEHFFYSEKLYSGKEGTKVLSDQPNSFTASHT